MKAVALRDLPREDRIRILARQNEGYPVAAYEFADDVLTFAVKKQKARKHVSAREFVAAAAEYAVVTYGLCAQAVLDEIRVRTEEDLGTVVYRLIAADLMQRTATETPEQFTRAGGSPDLRDDIDRRMAVHGLKAAL